MSDPQATPAAPPRTQTIFSRGYQSLLVTQFLGACNDNILKQIVALQVAAKGVWHAHFGDGGPGLVMLVFTLPFLVCSGWAGQMADRHSKQKIAQWMKIIEIPIAVVACVALWAGDFWFALIMLLILSAQSAFFGPTKYGMIAELVAPDTLGRANGAMNMLTNIAIIAGAAIGGILSERYPAHNLLPGMVVIGVALAGWAASLLLVPLPAADPSARYTVNPVSPYWRSLTQMARDRRLLWLALGGSFFYFNAVLAVIALPEFKDPDVLDIGDAMAAYLNIPLTVGIGAGSALAGALMRRRRRGLALAVPGALGMGASLCLLGLLPLSPAGAAHGLAGASYAAVCACLVVLGLAGGLFIVPFMTLLQERAPDTQRGRILGFANFLNFVFIAAAGGAYFLMRRFLSVQATCLGNAAFLAVFSLHLLAELGPGPRTPDPAQPTVDPS